MPSPTTNNAQLHRELTALCERHGVSQAVLILEYRNGETALSIRGTLGWAALVLDLHASAIRATMVETTRQSLEEAGLFNTPASEG